MTKVHAICVSITILAMSGRSMHGQDAPTLRQGNTEIGAFAGGGYGLGVSGATAAEGFKVAGASLHIMGGGDAGYAITKSLFLVAEGSYFPSVNQVDLQTSQQVPSGTSTVTYTADRKYDRKVAEYNAGVQYRLPVPERRWVPYVVGAIGGVRFSTSDITASTTNTSTGVVTQGQSQAALPPQTVFAIDGGAGLRFYATEHFGFRAEFRMFRPFGVDNLTSFYRFAGGIFFQLK